MAGRGNTRRGIRRIRTALYRVCSMVSCPGRPNTRMRLHEITWKETLKCKDVDALRSSLVQRVSAPSILPQILHFEDHDPDTTTGRVPAQDKDLEQRGARSERR